MWGTFVLTAHSGALGSGCWLDLLGWDEALVWLAPLALAASFGATAYTGFLFAQGLGRDLWQGPHATIDLIAQSAAEGAAALLVAAFVTGGDLATIRTLALTLVFAAIVHVGLLILENVFTPSPTRGHELAARAIRRGAYSRLFWGGAIGMGGVAPLLLVWAAAASSFSLPLLALAAVLALAGGFAWDYIWVEAGQSVPNS